MEFARIINSIRHLKPVQIYARPGFWLKRKFFGPAGAGYESRAAKELKGLYPFKGVREFSFNFLNRSSDFVCSEMRWRSSDWPDDECPEKLWLYHLNYFNWLFDERNRPEKELQLFLILDWIEKNPSAHSETWEPFPASKRIINWVIWLEKFAELATPIRDCIISSIYSQTLRLAYDLEFHNQANHLFENLTALLVGSVFLLKHSKMTPVKLSGLAAYAAENIETQLEEQFFADGGHYERSPMYHCEMLAAVEHIRSSCREGANESFKISFTELTENLQKLANRCQEMILLMQDWLANLTHPDGKIAQFNDSAIRPGVKTKTDNDAKPVSYLLEDSGFFVRRDHENYFVMSCKEPSPVYQPGHSHCDILSYELSLKGQRCIIDTGCGSYQNPQIRQHCRKTASHNTALVELSEQSEIWGSFRIGKRAGVLLRQYDSQSGILIVEMSDQYQQRFRREVIFADKSIRIRDRMYERRLTGTFCSLIHLHPDCQIMPELEPGIISMSCKDVEFSLQTSVKIRSEVHLCYPDFGQEQQTVKLILSNHQTEAIDYVISWK